MWDSNPLDGLSPEMRVGVAVLPFVVAMLLRFIVGRTHLSRWSITLSTMWFAINVLLAPYSTSIRQDLVEFGSRFR